MTWKPPTYPTFARELLAARAAMTLPDHIGLAVRADRRRRGLSQRGYAAARGWSAARVARLETRAGEQRLVGVEDALDGTGYVLALCHDLPVPAPVRAEHWPRVELLARIRDGSRRFPPHHDTRQITYPPPWWWASESTRIGSVEPHWRAVPPVTSETGLADGVRGSRRGAPAR